MADKKISQLTGATTPLAGTEELPLVQGGVTKKVAVSNFLLPTDIGATVQAYDVDTAKLDVAQTWTAAQAFNNTIGVGGATPAASGAGITFPATQSASSNANTLDDYEEGTFTPSYSFETSGSVTTTASITAGRYTKIGNKVFFEITIQTDSISSPVGRARIAGLPFVASATRPHGTVALGFVRRFDTDMPNLKGVITLSATTITFYNMATNDSPEVFLEGSDFNAGTNQNAIFLSGNYSV